MCVRKPNVMVMALKSAHQFQNLDNAIIIRVATSQTGAFFAIKVGASPLLRLVFHGYHSFPPNILHLHLMRRDLLIPLHHHQTLQLLLVRSRRYYRYSYFRFCLRSSLQQVIVLFPRGRNHVGDYLNQTSPLLLLRGS